jgi:Tautomerase enzyme
MPLAKVHFLEGQYNSARIAQLSKAIQDALIEVLDIPPDDFFQVHHVLPREHYRHTPSFVGQVYSDDLILLELTFITGRPKETRLALLKSLNEKVVAAVKIAPADLVVMLYEIAGENASLGSGLAQRAHIAASSLVQP